jgi:hypothetical protein
MAMIGFTDDWRGWRLRERHLVSPDGQRITRRRLEGLLWRDEMDFASLDSHRVARPTQNVQRVSW